MHAAVQRLVDPGYYPLEESLIESLGEGLAGELHLGFVLGPDGELSSCLDLGLEQGLGEVCDGQTQEFADLLSHGVVREDGLVRVTFLLKLKVSKVHDSGHSAEDSCTHKHTETITLKPTQAVDLG